MEFAMVVRFFLSFLVAVFPTFGLAQACLPSGIDPLEGFEPIDPLLYVDLPDPDFIRVTGPVETSLFTPTIGQEGLGPAKRYCQIGIQRMVVDFDVPVLDDAVAAMVTRVVYLWDTSGDMIGWRVDAVGERPRCARGDDPWAVLCP
ncbi:MAG: hypothetical protein AAGF56_02330 [Pseudomonadota bacterium]